MKGWVWIVVGAAAAAVAGVTLKSDTLKPFIVGLLPHPDAKHRAKGETIPIVSIPENLRGFIRV
jgi:hypothetical protein